MLLNEAVADGVSSKTPEALGVWRLLQTPVVMTISRTDHTSTGEAGTWNLRCVAQGGIRSPVYVPHSRQTK